MKLLAQDITHLTDARYFSARGAHYIGYSADRCTPEEVLAIMEWIDGPMDFLSWSSHIDLETIWSWTERTGISHVMLDTLHDELIQQLPDIQWMARADRLPEYMHQEVSLLIHPFGVPDSASPTPELGHYLLCQPGIKLPGASLDTYTGIAVSGSAESDIGWKDYGDLDDLLDQVEIDW